MFERADHIYPGLVCGEVLSIRFSKVELMIDRKLVLCCGFIARQHREGSAALSGRKHQAAREVLFPCFSSRAVRRLRPQLDVSHIHGLRDGRRARRDDLLGFPS